MDKAMEEFELALNTQGQEEEVERLYDLIISEFDRLATMAYMARSCMTGIYLIRKQLGSSIYNAAVFGDGE